jgi:hypothetical protein
MTMKQCAFGLAFALGSGAVQAADVRSVSRISFGPDNVLFVADWKAAKLYALELPAASGKPAPFNLLDVTATLRKTLNAQDVEIVDLAVRPGSGTAYLAVTHGAEQKPAIVAIDAAGVAKPVDLPGSKATAVDLAAAPAADSAFWGRIPARSFTVTDMVWREGSLYVAGLSNQDFASTLRRIGYPFAGARQTTSVEIYHASHNQIETRAPIRAMQFAKLNGRDHLVAAYTCTPLVVIPVEELKDGAHVRGKTIAELGFGNTPADMVAFSTTENGVASDYLLLVNSERSSDLLSVAEIAKASAKPGLSTPVAFGKIEGVETTQLPFGGVSRIDNLDDQYLLALRTDIRSGAQQLVTFNKQARFRLSDFVSEYNFPGYRYEGQFQNSYIKPFQNMLKVEEGYAGTVTP